MSFYLTNEYATACRAEEAARALEALAFGLSDLGAEENERAKAARHFARLVRRRKREIMKCHDQKQPAEGGE